jgi:hypothetical protein
VGIGCTLTLTIEWRVKGSIIGRSSLDALIQTAVTTYKWSRPASIIKELAKTPTFYEMDGQLVEEPRR